MKNRERHRERFLRELRIEDLRRESREEWCTREGAKEVMDDLTDREFEVVRDVLSQLYLLDEKFPTQESNSELEAKIAAFLEGKTIAKVGWVGSPDPDDERLPYLRFTDGTFFEMVQLCPLPGAIACDWGEEDNEEMEEEAGEET